MYIIDFMRVGQQHARMYTVTQLVALEVDLSVSSVIIENIINSSLFNIGI